MNKLTELELSHQRTHYRLMLDQASYLHAKGIYTLEEYNAEVEAIQEGYKRITKEILSID